jgi:hypothetical protein
MKKFIRAHICKVLEGFEEELGKKAYSTPLDSFLRNYLKANKALGSKDRASIADHVYSLVRHKEFLDIISPKPLNWNHRLDTFLSNKFYEQQHNKSLQP